MPNILDALFEAKAAIEKAIQVASGAVPLPDPVPPPAPVIYTAAELAEKSTLDLAEIAAGLQVPVGTTLPGEAAFESEDDYRAALIQYILENQTASA